METLAQLGREYTEDVADKEVKWEKMATVNVYADRVCRGNGQRVPSTILTVLGKTPTPF